AEFIDIAHKWRKIIGGGMRQAGVLAAAALYALEHNVERLKEDHAKAKYFANEINKIDGIEVELETVQTNMVIFWTTKYQKPEFIRLLKDNGVLVSAGSFHKIRAVFHLDVQMNEVTKAVEVIKSLF
ncbi:MAG TPA: beta-eliminating lyase-related protein, partial [Ignavibacteria bacterium]|nr:beta-eliminating lyase-related protein [Ignavibacteria bacterium]